MATGAFPFTTNAGRVDIDGVEAELYASLAKGLEVDLGGSYQRARLRDNQPFIPGNPSLGRAGDTLPNVPKLQGNASVSYRFPLNGSYEGSLRADANYRGRTKTQFNTASPFNVPLDEYVAVNLRASATSGTWSGSLFVSNLFNARAQIDAISSSQDPLALLTIRPRSYGLSITRKF